VDRPDGSITSSPLSIQLTGGRRPPHSWHDHSSSSRCRWEPQLGQHQESSRHRCPAATQVTWREPAAAQATSGSSALATTRQSGAAASASRQRRASSQISAARSIWSRLRLSSVTTRAWVALTIEGMYFSSVSSTAIGASGVRLSAETAPASMLAP
jgi:hypothetical protein